MTLTDYLFDIARTDDVDRIMDLKSIATLAFMDGDLSEKDCLERKKSCRIRIAVLQRMAGKESK